MLFASGTSTAHSSSIVSADLPASGLLIINNNNQAFGVKLTLTKGNSTQNHYFTLNNSTLEGPLTMLFDGNVIQAIELTPIANPDTDTTGLSAGTNPVTGFTPAATSADCIVRIKTTFT